MCVLHCVLHTYTCTVTEAGFSTESSPVWILCVETIASPQPSTNPVLVPVTALFDCAF